MTGAVPPVATDCLKGRSAAADIRDAMTIAYWMHGCDDGACAYQLKLVHSHFAALAAALGYRIERMAPEAAQ